MYIISIQIISRKSRNISCRLAAGLLLSVWKNSSIRVFSDFQIGSYRPAATFWSAVALIGLARRLWEAVILLKLYTKLFLYRTFIPTITSNSYQKIVIVGCAVCSTRYHFKSHCIIANMNRMWSLYLHITWWFFNVFFRGRGVITSIYIL